MDVKDFIKSTISQIAEAIQELNTESNGKIRVNVVTSTNASTDGAGRTSFYATVLDFKLALTVNDKSGSAATVGIVAGWFGGGIKGGSSMESAAVSTVSFKIPAMLPQG